MSHVSDIKVVVDDLDALAAAAARLGGELVLGQKTYAWWGRWVGDTPLPDGVSEADLGRCDHAIRFPGCTYEVGVTAIGDGTYKLQFDYWSSGGLAARLGGADAPRLVQAYGIERGIAQARALGYPVIGEEVEADGTVHVLLAG
jgi:hypothetical protein